MCDLHTSWYSKLSVKLSTLTPMTSLEQNSLQCTCFPCETHTPYHSTEGLLRCFYGNLQLAPLMNGLPWWWGLAVCKVRDWITEGGRNFTLLCVTACTHTHIQEDSGKESRKLTVSDLTTKHNHGPITATPQGQGRGFLSSTPLQGCPIFTVPGTALLSQNPAWAARSYHVP